MDRLTVLPSEIISLILSHLSTSHVLALTSVSRHLYHHALSALIARLTLASSIPSHTLVLDAYHPASPHSNTTLFCAPASTPELNASTPLAQLPKLFTHFYPIAAQARPRPARHPAGDVPGSRTHPSSVTAEEEDARVRTLTLDAGEMFAQMVVVANLVSQNKGKIAGLQKVGEGLVRVFRSWAGQATNDYGQEGSDSDVLWVSGTNGSVGLKLAVDVTSGTGGEEQPLECRITIRELLVRTTLLLRKLDASQEARARQQGYEQHGNAIVFGYRSDV